jgi:hypothetical protein
MTGDQALNQIREWWMDVPKHIYNPNSPETNDQIEFICNWIDPHPGPPPKRERE